MPAVFNAERLSQELTFRLIGSEKIWNRGAALTSRLQPMPPSPSRRSTKPWNSAASSTRSASRPTTEWSATMTRLSCNRFRSNEVRLWLTVITHNLENL